MSGTGVSPSSEFQARNRAQNDQRVAQLPRPRGELGDAREPTPRAGRMPQPNGGVQGTPADAENSWIFNFLYWFLRFIRPAYDQRQRNGPGEPADPQPQPSAGQLHATLGNYNNNNGNIDSSNNTTHNGNGNINNIGTHGTNNLQGSNFSHQ